MSRTLSVKNLYSKTYKTFPFTGLYKLIFGEPSRNGYWLIYGKEKNGKTWAALILANLFSLFERVLYVSAEEGTDMEFQASVKRAKIDKDNKKLKFIEYEPFEDLKERLKKRKSERIVIIDNCTVYADEIRRGDVKELKNEFPNHLFIFIAHEERGKPYTALAMLVRKYAKVYINVKGLAMLCGGRIPGGSLTIDEQKAELYHGKAISKK